jgi:hypothetical protein
VTATLRSFASAAAFCRALSEYSSEMTSSPRSASQTPLRPSPSAIASTLPRAGSSGAHDTRK